ncbi:dihydroorotate dehydrogenase, putative [Eimeria necatrix]|uniref:Dihydroorotate dehydrogenase (quinone), mitochondrial n=1 Tax=Eimeria necatrix TaxID=51315 RepID=U6MP37_9EIME|nr:dihydroorotate dehydrogenase, putative [Eimeria necatrix]CDJ64224.1 dihydroorotate dehydrogenase, putative [Eimeria necatrix]
MDGLLEVMYGLLPENFPDPEFAHDMVMWLAAKGYLPYDLERDDPELSVNIKGLTFHTPVGLAAGFDKDAEAPLNFCKMGFGFVEVGTITPKPQLGNPKPRIFRLAKDHAIINRCGFNSAGLDVVEPRLEKVSRDRWHDRLERHCVLGVNIGKNKDTVNAEDDIREGVKRVGRFADYLVINLSSPNTKGLRTLQQREHLRSIITAAQNELEKLEERDRAQRERDGHSNPREEEEAASSDSVTHKAEQFFPTQTGKRPLLFVKIAPDLTDEEKRDIADVALETGLDGLIVTNTTIQRPESLKSESKHETGGLSGRPLKAMSTKCVSDMYKMTNGQVAIIASGGIETGLDAYKRIRAGASAVEVYTSMIYRGPIVARRVKDELLNILNQAGKFQASTMYKMPSDWTTGRRRKNVFGSQLLIRCKGM